MNRLSNGGRHSRFQLQSSLAQSLVQVKGTLIAENVLIGNSAINVQDTLSNKLDTALFRSAFDTSGDDLFAPNQDSNKVYVYTDYYHRLDDLSELDQYVARSQALVTANFVEGMFELVGHPKTTVDTTPTTGSANLVTSGAVHAYVGNTFSIVSQLNNDLFNPDSGLPSKHPKTTVDPTPTTGSTNLVESGGVATALSTKLEASTPSYTITPTGLFGLTYQGRYIVTFGTARNDNNYSISLTLRTTLETNGSTSVGGREHDNIIIAWTRKRSTDFEVVVTYQDDTDNQDRGVNVEADWDFICVQDCAIFCHGTYKVNP